MAVFFSLLQHSLATHILLETQKSTLDIEIAVQVMHILFHFTHGGDTRRRHQISNKVIFLVLFLFSCYSHQSISDYSWEVYIVHSGVFAG